MAYKVTTNTEILFYDAIETCTVINNILTPIELNKADGFKAFTNIIISPQEELVVNTLYVFPHHFLEGYDVPEGIFEFIEDEESEEEEIEE